MWRHGKLRCGLLLLLLSPLAAHAENCLPSVGLGWLACLDVPLRSSWPAATTSPLSLETHVRLAEWSLDAQSPDRLRLHFDARSDTESLLRRWRYGAGLDLQLPGDGLLQASLSTSRRRRNEGARYALTPDGLADGSQQPLWSLALSLAPEDRVQGGRRLLLAPQLRVDLARWLDTPGRAELYVEYTPWIHDLRGDVHDAPGLLEDLDERVPQLKLRWRF